MKVGDIVIVHSNTSGHEILLGTNALLINTNGIWCSIIYVKQFDNMQGKGKIVTKMVRYDEIAKEFRNDTKLGKLL